MAANMLTTVDNPYNPDKDFVNWYAFDVVKGYNTCGYLARIANVLPSMTEKEQEEEINRAIDEIIRIDPLNMYIKVPCTSEKA